MLKLIIIILALTSKQKPDNYDLGYTIINTGDYQCCNLQHVQLLAQFQFREKHFLILYPI